jgi:hypothetical protein
VSHDAMRVGGGYRTEHLHSWTGMPVLSTKTSFPHRNDEETC